MNDYLRDMSLFVEIARVGSFSKASTITGVPISTLSRRLSDFEKRLGFQLIKRSTRRLELTELGHQYFLECERLVSEASGAHEKLLERSHQIEGTLKLSMTPDFGSIFFAPLLGEFARAHPLIKFELELTPHLTDLIANDIDVAIRFGHPADSRLTMRKIGSVEHWICASPAYIKLHGMPTDPQQLQDHTGIILRRANNPPELVFSKEDQQVALKTTARFHANHINMVVALALMDLGVALIPDTMAQPCVASGSLIRLMPDWKLPTVPVLAITPSRMQPARCRLFLEFIASRVSEVLMHHPN